jgi:hypothetical protein
MKIETLLPLFGVILGWGLKSISDYFATRKEDVRRYRIATFYVLKAHKSLMDYERGTRYFRLNQPTIEEFEP